MLVTVTAGLATASLLARCRRGGDAVSRYLNCRLGLGKASLLKPDAGQEVAEGGAVGTLVGGHLP